MAKVKGTLTIDIERCKGCEVCLSVCPFELLKLSDRVNSKGYNYLMIHDPDRCTGCTGCAVVCPDSCITVYREVIKQ